MDQNDRRVVGGGSEASGHGCFPWTGVTPSLCAHALAHICTITQVYRTLVWPNLSADFHCTIAQCAMHSEQVDTSVTSSYLCWCSCAFSVCNNVNWNERTMKTPKHLWPSMIVIWYFSRYIHRSYVCTIDMSCSRVGISHTEHGPSSSSQPCLRFCNQPPTHQPTFSRVGSLFSSLWRLHDILLAPASS